MNINKINSSKNLQQSVVAGVSLIFGHTGKLNLMAGVNKGVITLHKTVKNIRLEGDY